MVDKSQEYCRLVVKLPTYIPKLMNYQLNSDNKSSLSVCEILKSLVEKTENIKQSTHCKNKNVGKQMYEKYFWRNVRTAPTRGIFIASKNVAFSWTNIRYSRANYLRLSRSAGGSCYSFINIYIGRYLYK